MVSIKVSLALALAFVGLVQAAPPHGVYAADYYAYPKYSYSYGVKDALTGDQKSASETRDGDVVKGSYSLVQPDGVLRTVNYVAGPHTGFQAEVVNSPGPAIHAVKKVVEPIHHGYGHGIVAAKAVAPIAYGHGGGHGYGHAAPIIAAKSYSHGIGPVVGHHAGYGNHAALGYAGYQGGGLGHGVGYGGIGGFGGYSHGGGLIGHGGHGFY